MRAHAASQPKAIARASNATCKSPKHAVSQPSQSTVKPSPRHEGFFSQERFFNVV